MNTNTLDLLLSYWANAKAFLIQGKACSDFSFPSPDDEQDTYASFYLYGPNGIHSEVFIDLDVPESSVKSLDDGGHAIESDGSVYTVIPLVGKELSSSDEQPMVARYLQHSGNACPVCHKEEGLEGGTLNVDDYGATMNVSCHICNSEWIDVFKLSGLDDLVQGLGFQIGARVHWEDPDNNVSSGQYTVTEIKSSDCVVLTNTDGSVVEANPEEMTAINPDAKTIELRAFDVANEEIKTGDTVKCIDVGVGGDHCSTFDLKLNHEYHIEQVWNNEDEEHLEVAMVLVKGSKSGPVFSERFKKVEL